VHAILASDIELVTAKVHQARHAHQTLACCCTVHLQAPLGRAGRVRESLKPAQSACDARRQSDPTVYHCLIALEKGTVSKTSLPYTDLVRLSEGGRQSRPSRVTNQVIHLEPQPLQMHARHLPDIGTSSISPAKTPPLYNQRCWTRMHTYLYRPLGLQVYMP
jgi:hypothetical protein